jgi:hypothetical protein
MSAKPTELIWYRSTLCNNGACVETAVDADTVYLRDSKNLNGTVLRFGHDAWRAFIAEVKHGSHATQ